MTMMTKVDFDALDLGGFDCDTTDEEDNTVRRPVPGYEPKSAPTKSKSTGGLQKVDTALRQHDTGRRLDEGLKAVQSIAEKRAAAALQVANTDATGNLILSMYEEERRARIATYNREMLDPNLEHEQYDAACEITYDLNWFRSPCDYAVVEFVLIQEPTIPELYRSVAVPVLNMTKLTRRRLRVGTIMLTEQQSLCNLGVGTRLIPGKTICIDSETPGIEGGKRFVNIYEGVKGATIEDSTLRPNLYRLDGKMISDVDGAKPGSMFGEAWQSLIELKDGRWAILADKSGKARTVWSDNVYYPFEAFEDVKATARPIGFHEF